MEVYVYYRVAAEHVVRALESVEVAQAAALQDWPRVRSRVLRQVSVHDRASGSVQPDAMHADVTLMEVYTSEDASLTPQCAVSVLARLSDEPPGRTSARHVEYFEAMPVCGGPAAGAVSEVRS